MEDDRGRKLLSKEGGNSILTEITSKMTKYTFNSLFFNITECVCVCMLVCAHMHVCVQACVCVCARAHMYECVNIVS